MALQDLPRPIRRRRSLRSLIPKRRFLAWLAVFCLSLQAVPVVAQVPRAVLIELGSVTW